MAANNPSANMLDGSFRSLDSPDSDDFSNHLINFELSDILEIDNWPIQQDPTLIPQYSNYAANQVVNTSSYQEEPSNSKHFINTTFRTYNLRYMLYGNK